MKTVTNREWIEALRSGEYKQGCDALRSGGEYCCLGVLCEIAGVEQAGRGNRLGAAEYKFGNEVRSADVPEGFMGLSGYHISKLISMNDSQGLTFDQIADWIEEHVTLEDN